MDDMMSRINEILSDKESMEQIKQLAEMLGMSPPEDNSPAVAEQPQGAENMQGFPDISKLMMLQSMAKEASESDKDTALLIALKPHLSPERQIKADKAAKLLKVIAIVTAAKNSGLLDNLDSIL